VLATAIVTGTQAMEAQDNYVVVMEVDGLRRFRKPKDRPPPPEKMTSDSEEDSNPVIEESSDSSEFVSPVKGIKVEPRVRHWRVPHMGTVNKLQCMPQQTNIIATYSDTGSVHVYDMEDPLHSSLVWTSNAHQVLLMCC